MSRLEAEVRHVRARMRRAAALDAVVRWTLYASLLAGGALVAAKLFGGPTAPVGAALALPLAAGIAAGLRRLDLRTAAAAIDRALGLEERVATALEGPPGPMGAAVSADALGALERSAHSAVGGFRWPAQSRFLLPALAFVGLLALAPAPGQPAAADPALRAAVNADADRLARTPVGDAALAEKVKALLADLRSDDLKRITAGAEAARKLAVEIRAGLAQGGSDRETLRVLADRLEAAGAGASSELARRGIAVPDVAPVDLEARALAAKARGDLGSIGDRPPGSGNSVIPTGVSIPAELRREIEIRLAAKPVDRRYDEVVRRYFERYTISTR